tara:strand:+ start:351 stop:761 length:411 start_codon:yes stop_codon:yes gene_type:complete
MTFDELLDALKTYQDMVAGLNVNIKKIKRQILETKEAQDGIAPIRNEGGQRKVDNLTLEIKRTYNWDQDALNTFYYQQADDTLPSFITRSTVYKVDQRKYQSWATQNPSEALRIGSALSVKLGEPSIKSVDTKEEK